MIRSVMRTEVRDIIGELVADFWTDAELNRYLNEAQHRFNGEATWPWLITEDSGSLTADDPDFELDQGVDFTKNINLSLTPEGENRLYQPTRVSPTKGFQLRARYNSMTSAQRPMWYYVTSVADGSGESEYTTTIKFIPTPNATMEVEYQYFRKMEEMTADSDLPDLPVEYHKALVHYAAGTAWLKELNGGPKADEQFSLYTKAVEQARKEFFAEPNDQPLVLGKDEPQYSLRFGPGDPWMERIPETLGP